jgi:hypothetical protein
MMKTLDLNALGVREMSLAQMQDVEGGNWLRTLWRVLEALDLAGTFTEFCDGFAEGAQAGYEAQQS